MFFLLIIFLIIIILLSIVIFRYRLEQKHLIRQLNCIKDGSCIELTTHIRSKNFILLYQELNTIFSSFQEGEQKYRHSQKQLKQTISNIAHDIRTPLTSAAGYLQMLKECEEKEKCFRYEYIIEKQLEELKNMLEELFLYTKLTSEDFTLECKSTAVFPILSDCMIELYHVFEERNIEPSIHFEDETVHVIASPESLGRIFRNLINNALLHGNGELFITQNGNKMTFSNSVSNELIDVSQIFERFYKADKSRRKGSSGLGLAIVKELIQQMDGQIEAHINGNILEISLTFLQ